MIKKKAKKVLLLACLPVILPILTAITIMMFGGGAIGGLLGGDSDDCIPGGNSYVIDDKGAEANAEEIFVATKKEFPEATSQGICGMLGNFQQESQLSPKSIERQNDPLSGHGLAQWTRDRTTALMNFAKEKNKPWDNLGLQLEYLFKEIRGSEKAALEVLKMSDVHQATDAWQVKFERAGIPAIQNRVTYADHWYAKFGTSDPAAESAIDNGAKGENTISCAGTGESDGDIVKAAKKYIGWFHYPDPIAHNLAMIGGSAKKPEKEGRTDCSGLVWLVLENAGYKVPPDMGWFTGTMASDARGSHQWFKAISESEAGAGDVVIVNQGGGAGANGHTAILEEKWHGDTTKIIQMGGNGSITNEDTFKNSFLSLLGGGDICLARPVKK